MKKKSTSKSAFFNLRVLIASALCLFGVLVALLSSGAFSTLFAQTKGARQTGAVTQQDAPGSQKPDVIPLVGPVHVANVRDLPQMPASDENEEQVLMRYPHGTDQHGTQPDYYVSGLDHVQQLLKNLWRPTPSMPAPILTFEGGAAAQFCGCAPPDTDGDVGPNHYVEAINSAYAVYSKTGTLMQGPITYNTLFAPLGTGNSCGNNQNHGDPFVMYDHMADRWVISDFAFPSTSSNSMWECIAVSDSPDPTAGYHLYALQIDPANPTQWGDYPKMALWNNPQPGGAYHLTVNLWIGLTQFVGVRTFALDRASMLSGGPANAIAFSILGAGLGDSYSLVPANFRTGTPPPAVRDEMLLAVDSPLNENTTLTTVKGWIYHVDFATPANSTIGIGANHTPNALITVNPFVEAWTNSGGFTIVPQQGTTQKLDTLGDKIMTPVVYQNLGGTESLWADQTVMVTFPGGPSAVRWYQFDVTGGTFPATPLQQQNWSNGGDGVWRFMPSIAVDQSGNAAIGYSASSPSLFPGIRYAGRLASDPPSDLGQGEATMFDGPANQTGLSRWGDYTATTIDPSDGTSFWHVNEYQATSGSFNWHTRVGKFSFQGGGSTPTPTPTATPAACSWAAGAPMPTPGVRLVGAYFPANGKFYAMGGRASDNPGDDFVHPFEYNPASNSWTTKSATYPDNQVNNMACGVLNDSGTDYIYCVGGSAAGGTTSTDRVFRYNPVTDTITTGTPWPGAMGSILPGGFSVFNNKLYIFGGFNIGIGMVADIWEYTPGGAGTWAHKSAMLPNPLGYIPTATIGNHIYMAGGSTWDGTTIHDSNFSTVYDPVADTIGNIATIPRATAETRGLNFCNTMYVMGGGRDAPNPSNEVDIYDPVSNSWSLGQPFVDARRNFPTDTDGTNNIWLAGGYDLIDGITASMEIFHCPVSPCGTPTPTPTPTATATASISPTPTATVRPSPTPRHAPTPRARPTPPPRP
jgi:hypothetical protein